MAKQPIKKMIFFSFQLVKYMLYTYQIKQQNYYLLCIGTNIIQKYPRKETLDALLKYLNELVKQEIIKSNQWRILKKALSVILVEMYLELKVNTKNSTSKEDISQIKALIIRKPE